MRTLTPAAFAVLAVGCVILIIQNNGAISRLRAEQRTLSAQSQEARQLEQQSNDIAQLRGQVEGVEQLRAENADLPKLRNEVTQLRKQTNDTILLRAENQRLQAEAKNLAAPASPAAPFVPKAMLKDVGLGSPEATLQTFLWASDQGNAGRIIDCIGEGFGVDTNVAAQMSQHLKNASQFQGYQIMETREIPPDGMALLVRAPGLNPTQDSSPIYLKRIGNEWKIIPSTR